MCYRGTRKCDHETGICVQVTGNYVQETGKCDQGTRKYDHVTGKCVQETGNCVQGKRRIILSFIKCKHGFPCSTVVFSPRDVE